MSSDEALTPRRPAWTEALRVIGLAAAAFLAVLPFLTSRLLGGVDARWYAYMLRGFTDQIGSGHFPHLLGEGPFAWNGGVHPFRSAPIFMLVGGLWKILTLGGAGTYTVEHLTVFTSAIAGTLGFYRVASLFLGERRWTAAAFALLYLFTPSWLATVYKADAYMSYMAFAAMPLVLYGNARTLLKPDGAGYLALGAGLSLIWMCHPPIALLTTTTTLFIQAAAVLENGLLCWRKAASGVALFAVLSAYYFCSMSELPPRPEGGGSVGSAVIILVGIAMFLVGVGRATFQPGRMAWLLSAVIGILIIARGSTPWLCWAGFAGVFCVIAAVVTRTAKVRETAGSAVMTVFFCALAGAAAAEAALGKGHPGIVGAAINQLAINTGQIGEFLRPLSHEMNTASVFQPGWSVCLALVVGVIGIFSRGPFMPKVIAAAALTLGLCFMRFPMVSNFLVGYYPPTLSSIAGLPLPLRITPVFVSFAVMAGMLWMATWAPKARAKEIAANVILVAALSWSAFQTYSFVRVGYTLTSSKAGSEQSLRSENVMLDRYAYDLLPIPDYYSNGVVDPQLENRLLAADGSILVGPIQDALAMEKAGVTKVRMIGQVVPESVTWMDVVPKFTVQPGAHELLRFEFDPTQNYGGYLMFFSEHSYREYHLPDSGQPNAFGIGGNRSSVLAFWNTGDAPEHYRMLINREPGNTLKEKGGFFANLSISQLDPTRLPIHMLSLDPYHVVVNAPASSTLETFRIMLPGYKAYVDGARTPVFRTKNSLLALQVPAGIHDVVVEFVGTFRLWASAALSVLAWAVLIASWGLRRPKATKAF